MELICENCTENKYGPDAEEVVFTEHQLLDEEIVERHALWSMDQFIHHMKTGEDTRPIGKISTWKCLVCNAISNQHQPID